MEHNRPLNTGPNQESESLKKEVNATAPIEPVEHSSVYHDTKKDWNSKIIKMTMMIREEFPELSKFLNEMPVTVPDEKHPNVELESLKEYYNSLNALLNKYRLEHPHSPQR